MEDYGRRDWELPCVCGHLKKEHNFEPYEVLGPEYSNYAYCNYCIRFKAERVHPFKLDNLTYVEQVARAKGLI
jgi:hypothetical protein